MRSPISCALSALDFFNGIPRARRLTLGYKYFTATRLYQASLFFTFHRSARPSSLLLALIQPPIELESRADERHMGKGLRKITELFGRGT
jgi:hypothetical protein